MLVGLIFEEGASLRYGLNNYKPRFGMDAKAGQGGGGGLDSALDKLRPVDARIAIKNTIVLLACIWCEERERQNFELPEFG